MKQLSGAVVVLIMAFVTNGVLFAPFGEGVLAGADAGEKRLAQFFPDSGSPFKRMRYKKSSRDRSDPKSDPRDLLYKKLVLELQNLRRIGDLEAFRRIPQVDVLVNWHLGEKIAAHMEALHEQTDESRLTEQLAADLAEKKAHLAAVVRFYRSYRDVSRVSTALTWPHYLALIVIPDEARREDFQRRAIANKWSSDELDAAIRTAP